jgi:hypothetical protein
MEQNTILEIANAGFGANQRSDVSRFDLSVPALP